MSVSVYDYQRGLSEAVRKTWNAALPAGHPQEGNEIDVIVSDSAQTASFGYGQSSDGTSTRNTMIMPVMDSTQKLTRHETDKLTGYWLHEVLGHGVQTDPESVVMARSIGGQTTQEIHNGLEDIRIERGIINAGKYPNAKHYLETLCDSLMDGVAKTDEGKLRVASHPRNAAATLAMYGRAELLEYDMPTLPPKHLLPKRLQALIDTAVDAVRKSSEGYKGSIELVDAANQIAKELKGQNQQDQNQGQDQGQQQTQGRGQDQDQNKGQEGKQGQDENKSQDEHQNQGDDKNQDQAPEQDQKQDQSQDQDASQDGGQNQDQNQNNDQGQSGKQSTIGKQGQDAGDYQLGSGDEVKPADMMPKDVTKSHRPEYTNSDTRISTFKGEQFKDNFVDRGPRRDDTNGRRWSYADIKGALPQPAKLRNDIKNFVSSPERVNVLRNLTAGRFDNRASARMRAGDTRVFKRREIDEGQDAAVYVLTDMSPSMLDDGTGYSSTCGSNGLFYAATMCAHICEAVENAGSKVELGAFFELDDPNQDHGSSIVTVKPFAKRVRAVQNQFTKMINRRYTSRGTNLSPAILSAAKRLKKQNATRHILFVLTDGECNYKKHTTKKCVDIAEQLIGVEVVGLGIGTDLSSMFSTEITVPMDANKIAKNGLKILLDQLRKQPRRAA